MAWCRSSSSRGGESEDGGLQALNAALLELGMLSAVTDSRRQYLTEKEWRRKREAGTLEPATPPRSASCAEAVHPVRPSTPIPKHPLHGGLYVLQMNSDYITDVSTWDANVAASSGSDPDLDPNVEDRITCRPASSRLTTTIRNDNISVTLATDHKYKYGRDSLKRDSRYNRIAKIRVRDSRRQRVHSIDVYRPYRVPFKCSTPHQYASPRVDCWLRSAGPDLVLRVGNYDPLLNYASSLPCISDSDSSRDSGISNRSSPERNYDWDLPNTCIVATTTAGSTSNTTIPPTGSAGALVRSRSLDDLTLTLALNPEQQNPQQLTIHDIENMLRRMSDLRVT